MFAIWFLFNEDDNDYLNRIIQDLSKQYTSIVFVPHITAYGLVETNLETIEKTVLECIYGVKPFLVEKIKLNYSDDFWKTLFIKIKQNEYLNSINKKLTSKLSKFSKFKFLPHVSLIYKKMNKQEKEHLANNLDIKDSFVISKMGILEFSESIAHWKIVREYKFV